MPTHKEIDLRSRLLHQIVATKIRISPSLWDKARDRLGAWRRNPGASAYYDDTWARLMDDGQEICLAVAVEESERADALRQSSPFSCLLTGEERVHFLRTWKVWRERLVAGMTAEDESLLIDIILETPPLDEQGLAQLALEQWIVEVCRPGAENESP